MSVLQNQKSRKMMLQIATSASLLALNLGGMAMAQAATTTRGAIGNPVGNTYQVHVNTFVNGEAYTAFGTCFKFLPGTDPEALYNLPTLTATPFGKANYALIEPGVWQSAVVGDFGTLLFNGTVSNSTSGKRNGLINGTIRDYTHTNISYTFSGTKVATCTIPPVHSSPALLKLRKSLKSPQALKAFKVSRAY